ncbi:sugar kinase [Amycolatopsis alkalitolerans]|uniref:Sugar kinase n=1 Tax=Amycolatopsis alkalitolerans TaxID=2547244 RepID=A0A5C4M5X7_9PSEU|nr:sugar kinase [Amycolatopsis alkalitolerans]TNC27001.1 sugar kinase [Amycolatopsis alkalitolerans]
MTTRVLAIGECMIELTHTGSRTLSLGYAGDTFNTAVYLARLTSPAAVEVGYLTRLGDDGYSSGILAAMRAEGLGTGLIDRVPGAHPGLYLVRTDARGERSFTYYRSESPARRLFEGPVDLSGFDVLYLSAITLQLLSPPALDRLWAELAAARGRGARVVFDSNYRPAGWASADVAREAVRRTWELTSIALPTFSDERDLFGDPSPVATLERLRALGIADIAVKDGGNGCVVADGTVVPARAVESITDTTAAGDAFNAGYLAARLDGASPVAAAGAGHAIAAQVIAHPGAIIRDPSLSPRGAG